MVTDQQRQALQCSGAEPRTSCEVIALRTTELCVLHRTGRETMPAIHASQFSEHWSMTTLDGPTSRTVVDVDYEPVPRAVAPAVTPVAAAPMVAEVVRPAATATPTKGPRAVLKLVEDGIIV